MISVPWRKPSSLLTSIEMQYQVSSLFFSLSTVLISILKIFLWSLLCLSACIYISYPLSPRLIHEKVYSVLALFKCSVLRLSQSFVWLHDCLPEWHWLTVFMIDWLVLLLTDWLIVVFMVLSWVTGWSVDWLFKWMCYGFFGLCPVCLIICCSTDWLDIF